MSKIIYTQDSTSDRNYCVRRAPQVRQDIPVGSHMCLCCPSNLNSLDMDSRRKGIVLCADNNAEIRTGSYLAIEEKRAVMAQLENGKSCATCLRGNCDGSFCDYKNTQTHPSLVCDAWIEGC